MTKIMILNLDDVIERFRNLPLNEINTNHLHCLDREVSHIKYYDVILLDDGTQYKILKSRFSRSNFYAPKEWFDEHDVIKDLLDRKNPEIFIRIDALKDMYERLTKNTSIEEIDKNLPFC